LRHDAIIQENDREDSDNFDDNNNDDNHVNDVENDDDVSEEAESFSERSEHLCDDTAANDGTSEPESLAVLGLKYWP